MVEISNITLQGATPLAARLFSPPSPKGVAVINSATAVAQGYYGAFAKWLAETRSIACLTYDYRDFGASLQGPIRDSRATMADWGIHDQQTARDWLADRFPDLPLWVIGHSLGGFMLGYQTRLDRIDRVIAICSGLVNFHDHPWPYKAMAASFWWGHGAALVAACGYLPGRFSGMGHDIPGPVFRQWKRWCVRRGFWDADPSMPDRSLAGLRAPFRAVSLSDDQIGPPASVERLVQEMGPTAEHLALRPSDAGLAKVGHIGAFARRSAPLWPLLVD